MEVAGGEPIDKVVKVAFSLRQGRQLDPMVKAEGGPLNGYASIRCHLSACGQRGTGWN
jgi:hypothetical protein